MNCTKSAVYVLCFSQVLPIMTLYSSAPEIVRQLLDQFSVADAVVFTLL